MIKYFILTFTTLVYYLLCPLCRMSALFLTISTTTSNKGHKDCGNSTDNQEQQKGGDEQYEEEGIRDKTKKREKQKNKQKKRNHKNKGEKKDAKKTKEG